VLGFSKQAFFQWRASPVSQRDCDDAHLTNAAIDLHRDDPGFGYRFISDEIEAEAGLKASERRVWRLCSEQRLWSLHSQRRCLNRKAGPPVHGDLVLRDFTATMLNQLWLTDSPPPGTSGGGAPPSTGPTKASSTSAPSRSGSHQIVGYSIDSRMTARLWRRSGTQSLSENPPTRQCIRTEVRSIAVEEGRAPSEEQRPPRFHGPSRIFKRQCCDGVLFLLASEERIEYSPVEHPGGSAPRDNRLDREEVQPPPQTKSPRIIHPGRV